MTDVLLAARMRWLLQQMNAAYTFIHEPSFDESNPSWALDAARKQRDNFLGQDGPSKLSQYLSEKAAEDSALQQVRLDALGADTCLEFLAHLKATDATLPQKMRDRLVRAPKAVIVWDDTFPTFEEWLSQRVADLEGQIEAEVKRLPIRADELASYKKTQELINNYMCTKLEQQGVS